jgi:hypothetical protein
MRTGWYVADTFRGVLDIADGVTGHISRECPQPAEEVIDPNSVNNVVAA